MMKFRGKAFGGIALRSGKHHPCSPPAAAVAAAVGAPAALPAPHGGCGRHGNLGGAAIGHAQLHLPVHQQAPTSA